MQKLWLILDKFIEKKSWGMDSKKSLRDSRILKVNIQQIRKNTWKEKVETVKFYLNLKITPLIFFTDFLWLSSFELKDSRVSWTFYISQIFF